MNKITSLSDLRALAGLESYLNDDRHAVRRQRESESPGLFVLMASYNLGINYQPIYTTSDRQDGVLLNKIQQCKDIGIRHYIQGDKK